MKRKFVIACLSLCLLFLCFGFLSCREKSAYDVKKCNELVVDGKKYSYAAFGLKEQERKYTKRYLLSNGGEAFFAEDLTITEMDKEIEKLEQILQTLRQESVSVKIGRVYVATCTTTYAVGENLWINAGEYAEQILTVILAENGQELYPFGFYAGQAAYFLKKQGLNTIPLTEEELSSAVEENTNYKDLQYPLYWEKYVSNEEFFSSWSFSFCLVRELYRSYALENEKQIVEYISQNSTVSELAYRCKAGDSYYPIQVETPNITYYFCQDFKDVVLKEAAFALYYVDVKGLVEDTDSFIREVRREFGREAPLPEKLSAYFGQDLLTMSDGHGGQALGVSHFAGRYIVCRSLAVFTHEVAHQLLYFEEDKPYFTEELCELFADRTRWKRDYFFYIYSGEYSLEAEYEGFASVLAEARRLYDENVANMHIDAFDTKVWSSCLALAMNRRENTFRLNCQTNSFILYIYEQYGIDGVQALRSSLSVTLDGKSFEGLITEWRAFLENSYGNNS